MRVVQDAGQRITYALFLLSEDRRILWADQGAVEQTGYELDELLGRHCYEVTHRAERPCEGPIHPCPIRELGRTGKVATREHVHFDEEGRRALVEVSAYRIKGTKREAGAFIHVSSHISERQWVEEVSRETRVALVDRLERQMQRRHVYSLTFRQLTILRLVAAAKSDRDIATILGISPLTAHKHVANILDKMGAASRTDAAMRALREGLVD
jgi:PAS domain S-box-containing protein